MATKIRVPDAFTSADECAIDRALEAMHPPIEVHTGILLLIAEMAAGNALRELKRFTSERKSLSSDKWSVFDSAVPNHLNGK